MLGLLSCHSFGYAAELQLRTALNQSQFEVSAAPNENAEEVSALVHLAQTLDKPGSDLNRWTANESPEINSKRSGNERSNGLLAKNLPEAPMGPNLKSVDVIDHYETHSMQMPIYKTIQVEIPDAATAQ